MVDDGDLIGVAELLAELVARGAVARTYGLVLVESSLPGVVVPYSVLNDDDHDCLSEDAGAPFLSGVARLPA